MFVVVVDAFEVGRVQHRPEEQKMRCASKMALLSLLLCCPAMAQEHEQRYEYGNTLVCDTQVQAERYVSLYNGDEQETIDAVDAEERDPIACAFATVAFLRGAELAMVRNRESAFQIVQILVVGVETPAGVRAVRPAVYFELLKVTEYDV